MNSINSGLKAWMVIGLMAALYSPCLAEEKTSADHFERFHKGLEGENLTDAIASGKWLCENYTGKPQDRWRSSLPAWVEDFEKVVDMPPAIREEICRGLHLADFKARTKSPQELLSNTELAHQILSQHLPTSSMIRLATASLLAQRRRMPDVSKDPAVTVDLPMYHREAVQRYGANSDIAIRLDMERALSNILGEHPERGYEQMRHLLFSEEDPLPKTHLPMRVRYAADFIDALLRAEKHQWLQDTVEPTLTILSPYLDDESDVEMFASAATWTLSTFDENELWLDASNLCEFVLLHEEIRAPEQFGNRIHFLEHHVEALRKLDKQDEAAEVAAELAELTSEQPEYHPDRFYASMQSGDLPSAIASGKWLCKTFTPGRRSLWRESLPALIEDLEEAMTFAPDAREAFCRGLRLADFLHSPSGTLTHQETLERLELAYGIFSQHLPASSMIRLYAASLLTKTRRLRGVSEDPAVTVDLPMYHQAAVERHGAHSGIAIQLEMDRALNDILGQHPERGYEQMRYLLFSEEDLMPKALRIVRVDYAPDFISTLLRSGKHQWLQDNARRTLGILVPYLDNDTNLNNFLAIATKALYSFEDNECWSDASSLCEFVLLHEEFRVPEQLAMRIHFLEHRIEALRKLDKHDEAAEVDAELIELTNTRPGYHFDRFFASMQSGNLFDMISSGHQLCEQYKNIGNERQWDKTRAWVEDVEEVMTFSPTTREEISRGLRLADFQDSLSDTLTPQEAVERLELAYEIFTQHLPTNSIIRLSAASILTHRLRRRDGSKVSTVPVDLEMYHQEAVERYGASSDIAIRLEMERALHDILGEHPDRGFKEMRYLLFSEVDPMPETHLFMRITYAEEFIDALSRAGKHQWLQDNAKRTLAILSPHVDSESAWNDFVLTASKAWASFENSERWLEASEVCRFALSHEKINAPEHRKTRLYFLEHRVEALRELGDADELARVLMEISDVNYRDPARRSRYSED